MKAILSSTFFGPVQWYQKLNRYDEVLIEHCDHYQKQTYRNRCLIATTNGIQALTVPVSVENLELRTERYDYLLNDKASDNLNTETNHTSQLSARPLVARKARILNSQLVRISDHGNWRHQHWHALTSAYGDSPFFQYYEDDIKPFFTESWEYLYEYNEAIRRKVCELIDIQPRVDFTTGFIAPSPTPADGSCPTLTMLDGTLLSDFRESIQPKHPHPDADFQPRRYYQVYDRKHGFLPNLSILDLLFNMGPESIFLL